MERLHQTLIRRHRARFSSCCRGRLKICLRVLPYSTSQLVGNWQLAFEQMARPSAGAGPSTTAQRRQTRPRPWNNVNEFRVFLKGAKPSTYWGRRGMRRFTCDSDVKQVGSSALPLCLAALDGSAGGWLAAGPAAGCTQFRCCLDKCNR